MALESTRLLQSNVTQRLCLTVDSPPLNENVLRSAASTVSPTFSIADILASSYLDNTGEQSISDAGQTYKDANVAPDQRGHGSPLKPRAEDMSRKRIRDAELTASPDQSPAMLPVPAKPDTEQPGAKAQTEPPSELKLQTDAEPTPPECTLTDNTSPVTISPRESRSDLPEVNKPTGPIDSDPNRSCGLTRSELVQLDPVGMCQEVAIAADALDQPTEIGHGSPSSINSSGADRLHESLDDLLDAARCLRAETQLQEAEAVVDALIAKFAEPLDMYTAWENLHRSDPLPIDGRYMRRNESAAASQSAPSSSFSPVILPLLLSQPESSIFPQLCQPSSTGRKLFELCKQLAGDIRRLKRKLRVLHRARARRSASASTRPAILGHKPTITTAATTGERRSAFLRQLNAIWSEQPAAPEDGPSLDTGRPVPQPMQRQPVVPCVYTSPMECPLSLLSFVSESVDALNPHSRLPSRASHAGTDELVHYGRELTVQITAAENGQRSPVALSSCPSLSDTHTFPGVESPNLPTFSLLSPSLSPSSCSTISGGGGGGAASMLSARLATAAAAAAPTAAAVHRRNPRPSQRRETQSKCSTVRKVQKPSDSTSCSSSSGSSRSSSGQQKKSRGRGGRQHSMKSQRNAHKAKIQRGRDSGHTPGPCMVSSSLSPSRFNTSITTRENSTGYDNHSNRDMDRAPELQLPCPIKNNNGPNRRLQTKWEQLQIVVRDTDGAILPERTTTSGPLIAPDLNCSASLNRSSNATAPCSAPCVSFFQTRDIRSDEYSQPTMTDQQQQQQHPHSSCDNELDDSGAFSSSDEPNWTGHGDSQNSNNRPPTPDIRRSDLDLADLSDGTRVLVIQDTHLRAGTLYLGSSGSATSPASITLPTSSLRDQLFRIQLDAERPPTHHQGSPRFTSLPSPSRVSSVGSGGGGAAALTRRTSSPAQSGNYPSQLFRSQVPIGSGTPKKRRQSDLILYGWQVVQQAVLEVFPASVRHVPPGTRVCAAWSEQLAADLYPGTVTEAELKEQIQPNCVPVGFDDGDRRQVSIHNIRILPDNFTNLYELASSTYGCGSLVNDLLSTTTTGVGCGGGSVTNRLTELDHRGASFTRTTSRLAGRVRHHSAIDRPRTLSPLSDSVRTKRFDRVVRRTRSPSATITDSVQTTNGSGSKEEPLSPLHAQPKSETLSDRADWPYPHQEHPVSSLLKTPATGLTEPIQVHKRRHASLTTDAGISKSMPCAIQPQSGELITYPDTGRPHQSLDKDLEDGDECSSVKYRIGSPCQLDRMGPSESGNASQHHHHHHHHHEDTNDGSPVLENDTLSDSLSTVSTSSDQPVWHILDKVRRRRHGRIFCRSIVRQTDGLVISIGDSVEFSSGHDEVYLGEVRAIRWDDVMNAPVVTAAWYYNLNEAGEDGQMIMQLKGAVFATEHHDENEARCIVRRVVVAPSYAAYQAMVAGQHGPVPCDTAAPPLFKPDPDESHNTPLMDKKADRKSPADQADLEDHVDGLTTTAEPMDTSPDQQRKRSENSSIGEESEEAVYFIAGKYDPVQRRVISWDPDVSRMIKPS